MDYLIFVSADVAIKKAVAIEMRHLQIQLFVTGKTNFQSSYYFYDLMWALVRVLNSFLWTTLYQKIIFMKYQGVFKNYMDRILSFFV